MQEPLWVMWNKFQNSVWNAQFRLWYKLYFVSCIVSKFQRITSNENLEASTSLTYWAIFLFLADFSSVFQHTISKCKPIVLKPNSQHYLGPNTRPPYQAVLNYCSEEEFFLAPRGSERCLKCAKAMLFVLLIYKPDPKTSTQEIDHFIIHSL